MTKYHPESWQPAWTVRTMLEALISTFLDKTEEMQGVGGLFDYNKEILKKWAIKSQSYVCDKCGPIKNLLINKVEEP